MEKFNYFINKKKKFFFDKLLKNITLGTLKVKYPDGDKILYQGNNYNLIADIELINYNLIYDIFFKGNIGFAESYINKNFITSNLSNLIELIILNKKSFKNIDNGKIFYRLMQKYYHYQNNNSKINSLNNISYHYDLGNEFYSYWLDKTMSYSSGLYNDQINDLEIAQLNKYKRIVSMIKPSDQSKILEIGCGWGSLANYIVKNTNAHVTAVTISKSQYEHTSKLIQQNGLNEKIKLELKDYRDINKKFDSIISIEMFEAVGEKYWPVFFKKLRSNLKNNGKAIMQVITIADNLFESYKKRPDFIQRYIFPGGMLPSKEIFRKLITKEGFILKDEFSFASSYVKTLKEWNERFQDSWPKVYKKGFNEYFKRMWEYYFNYCEGGFRAGSIDISQFLIK